MNRSVFIIALCVLLGAVCPIGAGESAQIDFAHDIVPILRKRCIECHGGPEAKGGMSLNTRSTLLDAAAIVPGRANESRIVELVTSADPEEQMPPKDRGRLTDAEVDMLRRWIDAGAAWEEGFTFDEARYEPPLRPRQVGLPPAQGGRTNPIDRILDAYRVERDLPTLRPLDDAAFLRRLSLDIVGLLPNAEEMHAVLADEQPDKRDQMIAR
ncbi:MAG: c-type cytochrome domain-containing protein, partial [Planctomycetaceae bacterium]